MFAYCNNNPVNAVDDSGNICRALIEHGSGGSVKPKINAAGNVKKSKGPKNSDVPYYGKPGSTAKSPDGTKERVYGPDGLPSRDRHYTDHGNPKQHPYGTHDHDWGYDENGKWTLGEGYPSSPGKLVPQESFSQLDIDEQVMSESIGVGIGVIIIYEIVKWGIAVGCAPMTYGGSLIGAAAAP